MNALDIDKAKELAEFLRQVSQFQRLQILGLLVDGPLFVSDIEARTEITQPTLSQHLGVLRRLGLIVSEKKKRSTIYSIANDAELCRVKLVLAILGPADFAVLVPFLRNAVPYPFKNGRVVNDVGAQFARILNNK